MTTKTLLMLSLLIGLFSCDDSDKIRSISDSKGILFELRIINPDPSIEYPSVGMTGYYPDKRVYFSGHDSIGIENYYPDGEYRVESKNYQMIKIETAYELKVSGITNAKAYKFKMTFYPSDTLNTIKKTLLVDKKKNTFTILSIN